MKNFLEALTKNLLFALEFLGIAVVVFAVAYVAELLIRRKKGEKGKYFTTRRIVTIAMLSAIAGVLMVFDFPVFFVPSMYKLDFSELPALIAGFAYGPLAGVVTEFVKILVKLMIKGTSTAFVGELANFLIGAVFVLTASLIYAGKKKKSSAVIGCVFGTLLMALFGCILNAVYLLPAFSRMFGMSMEAIIAMGNKINKSISDVYTFVAFAVAPLNLVKGAVCSTITLLVYKKLRKVIQ